MWQTYIQPGSLEEALQLLKQYGGDARIIAGGTDVLVELQRGVKPTTTLIDISTLDALRFIRQEENLLVLGALTTHNDILRSALCQRFALPLVQACSEVGAPQIRTRATVVGNLVTASPANDTIALLMALGADVVLVSASGERVVPLSQFYHGVRRTALQPGELIRAIRVPLLTAQQRGLFVKLGLRRAQAISVVNAALVLTFSDTLVQEARITLGCVAPTIIRARSVENFLAGKPLNAAVCEEAANLVKCDIAPIDDIRASASYRVVTLRNLLQQSLQHLSFREEISAPSMPPVLLETPAAEPTTTSASSPFTSTIETRVNGTSYSLKNGERKTLLNLLREDVGLTGTKEGCAEGECGACTVWLDGQAVMSCLVPAVQAHGACVTTIEGLARGDELHPLQQAFIDCAAVQCGFCIPGMLMAGAKLFDEAPQPDERQIRTALSGNICRCTGYRKILDAMLQVAGEAR